MCLCSSIGCVIIKKEGGLIKARVVVTLDCSRQCPDCCNHTGILAFGKKITDIEQLLGYEEIIITGGEPILIYDKVEAFIKMLRSKQYEGEIYLYSALYRSWAYEKLLPLVDGLHFTLHAEARDQDIIELKALSKVIADFEGKSFRLSIDNRLYDKYDFSNINFSHWSVIRKLQWLKECPLPAGEELVIFEL